jgi:hypothetical protein
MKKKMFFSLCLVLIFGAALSTLARAECYGDAAEAYGCGAPTATGTKRSTRPAPSLESFGGGDGPVLPNLGYNQNPDSEDVITPEERRRMMRSIVLGRGGASGSESAHQSAINNAGRPLRRASAMPDRTR